MESFHRQRRRGVRKLLRKKRKDCFRPGHLSGEGLQGFSSADSLARANQGISDSLLERQHSWESLKLSLSFGLLLWGQMTLFWACCLFLNSTLCCKSDLCICKPLETILQDST